MEYNVEYSLDNKVEINFIINEGQLYFFSNLNLINNFLSNLHYVKTVNVGQLGHFKKHQKRAKEILELLKKEYPNIDMEKE